MFRLADRARSRTPKDGEPTTPIGLADADGDHWSGGGWPVVPSVGIPLMIRDIHIEHYRCLRSVDIRFTPLTALVGPNGSGKTAVLEALQHDLHFTPGKSWRKSKASFRRSGSLSDGRSFNESLGHGHVGQAPWAYLLLNLQPSQLRSANVLQEQPALSPDGGNLVNVFATLPRKTQDEVAQRLRDLAPLYADVNARPLAQGQHRLVFQDRWDERVWYEPSEVSDGTIVLLAFLLLPYMKPAVHVL